MPEDRSHDLETDAERSRRRALVRRLSDDELRRPMPGGWTVAAVLAHAANWDPRAAYWLDTRARGTAPSPYELESVEAVNDAAKPLCLALPSLIAARAIHRKEHVDDIERLFAPEQPA